MMRQDFLCNGTALSSSTVCGNCGVVERFLLHGLRHRGNFRKLCTTCVLRLHSQFFCPTCFTVYHPSPPRSSHNEAVSCCKCYSISHTQCVGHTPPNPYTCPLCVSPNSSIFNPRKVPNVDGKNAGGDPCRVIDKSAARIFLAAAKIAANSMSTAAAAARVEAEKRAKEAAFARKRAREALEHVSYMAAKEKMRKDEASLVQRGIMGGIASSSLVVNYQSENMDKVKNSGVALTSLNKELAEGKLPNNIVHMDVVEDEEFTEAPDALTGLPAVQDHEDGHENGMPEDIAEFAITDDQDMSINSNGVGSLPAEEDKDQQTRLILAVEQNNANLNTA